MGRSERVAIVTGELFLKPVVVLGFCCWWLGWVGSVFCVVFGDGFSSYPGIGVEVCGWVRMAGFICDSVMFRMRARFGWL